MPELKISTDLENVIKKLIQTDLQDLESTFQDVIKNVVLNTYFPVGSLYMTTGNEDPNISIGGTWEQIKDRFLLACGDTYANGTTGGEATHKLTVEEMPSHKHTIWTAQGGSWARETVCCGNTAVRNAGDYDSITYAGGNQPHNNMPPYLAVYVWKRTG